MQTNQAELFVSYSRANKGFVRRLNDRLSDHQREAWVDWEGIAPTAEWMAEIMLAIDQANSFLFVITEASLASEICGKELDHAVSHGKRLIPILHEDIAPDMLPPSLAGVQWIPMRPTDDFDAGVAQLIEAIDTDLEHVKTHTRFLLKAIEWEDGAEAGRLLRGLDLERAEQWLVASAEKEPKPTALHSRHVIASRTASSRQQRRTIGAIAVALAATTGLAAFAWQQRGVALENEQLAYEQRELALANEAEAERQSTIAVANEQEAETQRQAAEASAVEANRQWLQAERENVQALINGSRSFLSTGQELEALTAALTAAIKVRDNPLLVDGTVDWHRTVLTLRRALFETRERNRLRGDHGRGVTQVAFHPDAQSLYLAGGDRWISQMTFDGREINRFETMHYGLSDGCTGIAHMAVNPADGSIVTVGNEQGFARWAADGTLLSAIESEFWAPAGEMQCSGLLDVSIYFDRNLVTMSSATETRSWTFDGLRGPDLPHPDGLSLNPPTSVTRADGAFSAQKPGRGQPITVTSADGAALLRLPQQRSAVFHPASDQLVTVADTIDDTVIHFWDVHSPDISTTAIAAPSPTTQTQSLTLNGTTFEVLPFGRGNDPRDFFGEGEGVLSADMKTAAVLTDFAGTVVEIWALPNGPDGAGASRVASFPNNQIASADFMTALSGMSFHPDGTMLATAGTDGTLKLWQRDGTLLETMVGHPVYATVSFSPDGLLVLTGGEVTASDPSSIKVWSLEGELLDTLGNDRLDYTAPYFTDDGRAIIADTWESSANEPIWVHDLDWLIASSCDAISTYLSHGPVLDAQRTMCADAASD